jgi:hypothetical protein
MVKKPSRQTPTKVVGAARRKKKPEIIDEEEEILRAATIHLIRKHGGLLVATGLREEHGNGSRQWIITVTLRYPTGHEGYIGDLLYDGRTFSFLTSDDVIVERARQIEADPALQREWDAFRTSTLPARKA